MCSTVQDTMNEKRKACLARSRSPMSAVISLLSAMLNDWLSRKAIYANVVIYLQRERAKHVETITWLLLRSLSSCCRAERLKVTQRPCTKTWWHRLPFNNLIMTQAHIMGIKALM